MVHWHPVASQSNELGPVTGSWALALALALLIAVWPFRTSDLIMFLFSCHILCVMSHKSNLQEEWLICAYGVYYYGILTQSFSLGCTVIIVTYRDYPSQDTYDS